MDHSEVKHFPKVDHTPAELDGASKLLLKAAAIIEEMGWCQNSISDAQGRVCFAGAMKMAAYGTIFPHGPGAPQRDMEEGWRRLENAVGVGEGLAHKWNDVPGRTKEEVVAKIRAVALGL